MAATVPPLCDFGWKAPPFALLGIDGGRHSLESLKGEAGTLVAFICNHCPYVRAIAGRIERDAAELRGLGIATVAIMPNDSEAYPEDGYEGMKDFARENGFSFPYLIDETQAVAKAYGAVCTPDFFGFDRDLGLQYRGRLDASKATPVPDARRDLFEAMAGVAKTGRGPEAQEASMGCSIKWRPGNAPD